MDSDDFADWYRDVYRRVFAAVLVTCGDPALAADATDEAFARAFERWPRVRTMSSPAGWTFTVARNVLRRMARRTARERLLALPPSSAQPEITPEVWDAVRTLPKREREFVALRYVVGLTEPEIASTLGVANGTVARGLHDARARLRSLLETEEDPR